MPKVQSQQRKRKYYAVKVGKEGPRIYDSWDEAKENVSRYPNAVHKSFLTRTAAEQWLAEYTACSANGTANSPILIDDDDDDARVKFEDLTQVKFEDDEPFIKAEADEPDMKLEPDEPDMAIEPEEFGMKVEAQEAHMPMALAPDLQPAPPQVPQPAIILSVEQRAILQRVAQGENVFFTGSAGTGKSVLLREIIKALKDPGSPLKLAITASTGIASVNIGGTTLHSWAGIGLGEERAEKLAGKIIGQRGPTLNRWKAVRSLIIDEISMIDGRLFDKLDHIGRATRRNERPFGGIQLILSGDFCQLPPVPQQKDGVKQHAKFAFDSDAWQRCIDKPVTLTRVFRQKEGEFVDMLNKMRYGRVDDAMFERFRKLTRPITYDDGIGATELYPTRREVDNSNHTRLKEIRAKQFDYTAWDRPGVDSYGNKTPHDRMLKLLEKIVCPEHITLKAGAQVMLIKNLEQGILVNGSTGKVLGFSSYAEATRDHTAIANAVTDGERKEVPEHVRKSACKWPLVRFTNGRELLCIPQEFTVNNGEGETEAARLQVPLILAWALSVHKSQGQTLERVKVDLSRTFEKGQAYVALSRATTLDRLEVLNFDFTKVMAHPRVLEWHRELESHEEYEEILDDDFTNLS